jgi:hypothetical protein
LRLAKGVYPLPPFCPGCERLRIDLTTKLRIYRRNQVQEYLVWRVLEQSLDWFVLRNSQYERLSMDDAGFCKSEVFPGLWLDAAALTRFDPGAVLRGLQKGLASPEHAAFVARLGQAVAQAL